MLFRLPLLLYMIYQIPNQKFVPQLHRLHQKQVVADAAHLFIFVDWYVGNFILDSLDNFGKGQS